MTDTLKRKPKADKSLPPEVRLVGTIDGGPVLIDAENFGSPFQLTPAEFIATYGGDPNPPESEHAITQRRANAQNDEAIRSYARGDQPPPANVAAIRKHVAAEGRPTETPEERFASEAARDE
jgi:hypothetical protein